MARLNEPLQPSVESIDALKRRFIRQNREIARANSTQSLRIRNLESEVSRLLSENVSLREQIIKLHQEIEKGTSQPIQDSVDNVKAKLEEKLAELGGLVKELGQVQKSTESRRIKRRSTGQSSPKRSPDQRNWKNTLTLSEATGGVDGRLPPIVEDKYYPRRTMDAGELLAVFADPANVTDSPDLGPPPVAHFDEGDPIKFDPKPENPVGRASLGAREESHSTLPTNLETRRKRRESSHHRDIENQNLNVKAGQETVSKDPARAPEQPLKAGAKRKLNVRDEEDVAGELLDPGKEMLQFKSNSGDSRTSENTVTVTKPTMSRTSKPARDRVNQAATASVQIRKEKATETSATAAATNRRALGPKNVNTDLANSPVKSKDNGKLKVTQAKEEVAKTFRERNQQKDKAQSGRPTSHGNVKEAAVPSASALKIVDPPPETPAPANDLFSPGSSEPSAARAESRDTPPPPDLGPDTGTGSFGRASRRSRGSVNYAQPNLRDKMRRPTSELVDAVGAEERLRQANLAKVGPEKSASVVIKQEEDMDALPIWKTNDLTDDPRKREEPTSPLSRMTGGSATELAGSIMAKQRRQSIMASDSGDASDPNRPSGAASAIAALTARIHRSKRQEDKSSAMAIGDKGSHEPEERLSIYDFTGSSPPDTTGDASDKEVTEKRIRSSRRHSSMAASSDQGPGTLSISRRVESRRESILSRRGEGTTERGTESQLSRTKSVLDLGPAGEDASSGRGERAASRRRSMML